MSRLPRAEAAFVDPRKLRDYLLVGHHPQNGGKAGSFAAFGFDLTSWSLFRDALAHHPVQHKVIATEVSQYGTKYVVRCQLETPDGRNPCIATIWFIVDNGVPCLVTAYP